MRTTSRWVLAWIVFTIFLNRGLPHEATAGTGSARTSLTPQPLPTDFQPISYADAKRVNLWWSTKDFGVSPPLPPGAVAPDDDGVFLYYSPSANAVFVDNQNSDDSLSGIQSSLQLSIGAMDSPMDASGTQTGFGTNDLWAETIAVTNDAAVSTANLIIHPPAFEASNVFDVFYTRSLQEPLQWYWVYRTIPGETNIWPGGLGLDSGYFKIADTNGPVDPTTGLTAACMGLVGPAALTNDLNSNGVPDFWEVTHLPGLMPGNTDFDHDGLTISNEWAQSLSPNKLGFSLSAPRYATSQNAHLRINMLTGVPSTMAIVENANFSAAAWQPFNSNPPLSLSPGWHELWVALQGRTPDQYAPWKRVRFKVDDTPPVLVLTNPVSNLGPRPVIQLSGYSLKPLSSLTFSLTNDSGPMTGQALLLNRAFDPAQNDLTTNWFRCLDVGPFTPGINCVTLTATDLAGNVTQTNFLYAFTTNGTAPPTLGLTWPADGAQLSGDSFTLRGTVDNETATVVAQITDSTGNTTTVNALIERNGSVWADDVPVADGTNTVTVTATDAAGNSSTTTFSVVKSSVQFDAIWPDANGLNKPTTTVSGHITDPTYSVWVNGVQAENQGLGSWIATNVPVTPGGEAIFTITASPSSESAGTLSCATELHVDKPPFIYQTVYHEATTGVETFFANGVHTDGIAGTYSLDWALNGGAKASCQYANSYRGDDPVAFSAAWPADGYPATNVAYVTIYRNGSPYESWDRSVPDLGYVNQTSVGFTMDYAGWSGGFDDFPLVYEEQQNVATFESHAEFSLATGGRDIPGKQALHALSADMGEYAWDVELLLGPLPFVTDSPLDAEWWFGVWDRVRDIPGPETSLGSLGKLGDDHTLYCMLADGQSGIPITPVADSDNYGGPPPQDLSKSHLKIETSSPYPSGDITGKTTTVYVGQKVSLNCEFDGSSPPEVTRVQWSIPPYAISNYTANAYTGMVWEVLATNSSQLNFYWGSGGTKPVTCEVWFKMGETTNNASAQTTFNVLRPNASWVLTPKDQVRVTNYVFGRTQYYYYLTSGFGVSTNDTGMLFEYRVNDLKGYRGNWIFEFIQIANLNRRANLVFDDPNLHMSMWATNRGLDNGVEDSGIGTPRPRDDYRYDHWYENYGETEDNPFQALTDAYSFYWLNDSFESYLMFKPEDGIPVPIKVATWNWAGQAQAIGTNSPPVFIAIPPLTNPKPAVGSDTIVFPQWTTNAVTYPTHYQSSLYPTP